MMSDENKIEPRSDDSPPPADKAVAPERPRFSRIEKLLIFLALQIVAIMVYSYVTDTPLKTLLGLDREERFLSTPIGTVTEVVGRVTRQRANTLEFKALLEHAPVYPNDTIMTGPDSTATIVLKNGRVVRLTPNSLIKLTWGADMRDDVSIDVLQGGLADDRPKVVPLQGGKPQPPVGTVVSVPLAVLESSPASGIALSFTAEEFEAGRKPVAMSVKLNQDSEVTFVVRYRDPRTGKLAKVASNVVKAAHHEASTVFLFDRPGKYQWELLDKNDKPVLTSKLTFGRVVELIKPLPPGNATARLEGEASKKTFEGLILKWTHVGGPGAYLVKVFRSGSKRPLVTRETVISELRLSPSEISFDRGALKFSVEKPVERGFLATSGLQTIKFEIAPPALSAPAPHASLTRAALLESNHLVFFTWSKTNYTSAYELVLADEPRFEKPLLTRLVKDNFYSLKVPAPGRYYWRVRSRISGFWSPFSEPRRFDVERESP